MSVLLIDGPVFTHIYQGSGDDIQIDYMSVLLINGTLYTHIPGIQG